MGIRQDVEWQIVGTIATVPVSTRLEAVSMRCSGHLTTSISGFSRETLFPKISLILPRIRPLGGFQLRIFKGIAISTSIFRATQSFLIILSAEIMLEIPPYGTRQSILAPLPLVILLAKTLLRTTQALSRIRKFLQFVRISHTEPLGIGA